MSTPYTLETDQPQVFTRSCHDNSALRARLSGQTVQQRPIEAELRAAMAERTGEPIVDLRTETAA